jgi:hypothetical protein
MPNNSFTVVTPPKQTPPRVSLLASAEEVNDNTRWQAGLTFEPIGCGSAGGFFVGCADPSTPSLYTTKDTSEATEVEIVEFEPYTIWESDVCSPATFQSRDFVDRATARYLASESALMAREFWAGSVASAASLPNFFLANGDATDVGAGSALPVNIGLQVLQNAVGSVGSYFGRHMIHAPRDVVSAWYEAGLVRREGVLILDAFDNIVVADGGYPGTGPNGESRTLSSAWIYATDPVQVRRDGQIRLLPSREETMGGAALNRDTNLIEWRVERLVAAYPAGCLHLTLEVDLCETDCPLAS